MGCIIQLAMKTNEALKALRKIIGRSQVEFAALIGASKDTVVSWEIGRNKLSSRFAKRIYMATVANPTILCRGKGALLNSQGGPYTKGDFDGWTSGGVGESSEREAQRYFDACSDALWLLFSAAAMPGAGKIKNRLPAVRLSFVEWLEGARQEFKLAKEVDALLEKRAHKESLTMDYAEWRKHAKSKTALFELYGFKDDKRQPEGKQLRLESSVWPRWIAGSDMRQQPSREQ